MLENRRNVDSNGIGTELRGTIEKRHPKSQISIGEKSRIDGYVVTEIESSRLSIGKNTIIGSNTKIDCVDSITIGDDVLISYDCIIADADNHSLSSEKRKGDLERWRNGTHDWSDVQRAPIVIKDGAWIGARAIIQKGVTIGEGAIVGMGSVVVGDVPPFTLVLGHPARAIKKLLPGDGVKP